MAPISRDDRPWGFDVDDFELIPDTIAQVRYTLCAFEIVFYDVLLALLSTPDTVLVEIVDEGLDLLRLLGPSVPTYLPETDMAAFGIFLVAHSCLSFGVLILLGFEHISSFLCAHCYDIAPLLSIE